MGHGIKYLKITTDPVELWAAPNSRSRIEREFFDSNFEPFYRIEQIIIKANLPSFTHNTSNGVIDFGPAFNKDFLLEVLTLQNQIKGKTLKLSLKKKRKTMIFNTEFCSGVLCHRFGC